MNCSLLYLRGYILPAFSNGSETQALNKLRTSSLKTSQRKIQFSFPDNSFHLSPQTYYTPINLVKRIIVEISFQNEQEYRRFPQKRKKLSQVLKKTPGTSCELMRTEKPYNNFVHSSFSRKNIFLRFFHFL